jgi:serine/threonine-protein kinase
MSPEQLVGKKIDGRSDLYSLGVMLYQLASGQLPFVGESMAQLMYRIANEAAPDIQSINPALPLAVKQVIDKAMAKNVMQRYQTGADMAADLRACLKVPTR